MDTNILTETYLIRTKISNFATLPSDLSEYDWVANHFKLDGDWQLAIVTNALIVALHESYDNAYKLTIKQIDHIKMKCELRSRENPNITKEGVIPLKNFTFDHGKLIYTIS